MKAKESNLPTTYPEAETELLKHHQAQSGAIVALRTLQNMGDDLTVTAVDARVTQAITELAMVNCTVCAAMADDTLIAKVENVKA